MKELNYFFNTERFNPSSIADQLYSQNPGVMILPDILREEARLALKEEIHNNKFILEKAKERYGRAKQNFLMYYWGTHSGVNERDINFPLVSDFSQAYSNLTKHLVEVAGLAQKRVSSTGIHIYWENEEQGLSPHRDESNVQLVSVFNIEGFAEFYVSPTHSLEEKQTFYPHAGSLTLMRGPRNLQERALTKKGPDYNSKLDPRPIHCVGPVQKERTAILLRHILEEENV